MRPSNCLRALICAMLTIICCAGCNNTAHTTKTALHDAPLFHGMGGHHRAITTDSPSAQRYFDQGLVWAYAFNHDEAIRSFIRAAELDPDCAMAYWGIALCNGPHINNPVVPPDRAAAAWDALQKANARINHASPAEQALIRALATRYTNPQPADRAALDAAYADAMAKVWQTYPDDSDIGTLYAEAMMDLHPWDLYTQTGQPKPGTDQILAVLEEALRLDSDNPGANHLYIHATEASANPARANAAAQRLRRLVPASGHLVHMPSHVDVLTGRWQLASQQNEAAIKADRAYRKISPKQGFYRIYMLHNHHMLSFASMMEGRSAVAIRSAREAVDGVPEEYRREQAALVDAYMGAAYDALKRFGRWDAMLREPAPPAYLPITNAMWRFNRAIAFAAKGEVANAECEKAAFLAAAGNVPDGAVMAINPAAKILDIARHFLDGEIAYRKGDIDSAVASLHQAIELEDSLLYMEPPEWMQPVRHTLGAVLLDAHRPVEAEKAYREDLAKWPNNGWSLYGLSRALRMQGRVEEAKDVEAQFAKAWSRADTPLGSSCLCVPKT